MRLRSAEWLAACLYVGQSTDWILERDGCRSDLLHAANTRERLMFASAWKTFRRFVRDADPDLEVGVTICLQLAVFSLPWRVDPDVRDRAFFRYWLRVL